MLNIYTTIQNLIPRLVPTLTQIERRDSDLARQMRRALTSVPLNVSEGSYSRGKNRFARYATAAGSMREVLACTETAASLGYIEPIGEELADTIDHILAVLVKNTK
jgi:four helix bundle protein